MVEFPLVARRSAGCPRRRFKISSPDPRRLPTLTLRHQTGALGWLVCGKLAHSLQASTRGRMSPCGILSGARTPVGGDETVVNGWSTGLGGHGRLQFVIDSA